MEARARTPKARWSWVELEALGPDLATGLRAALATVIPLTLSLQLARWLATLTDPGGSRGRRARISFAFVVLSTLLVWGGDHAGPAAGENPQDVLTS